MEVITGRKHPFLDLFKDLRAELGVLVRQEVQLAKTEMTEKAVKYGRNAAMIAVGGVAAFAGLIVFLIGLGFLIAWAFEGLGLAPAFADFVGLAIIGAIVIGIGAVMALKAQQTIAHEKLAPEKTLDTLRMGEGRKAEYQEPKVSSNELKARVELTRHEVDETLSEIRGRMTVARARAAVKRQVVRRPGRALMIGLACGVAGAAAIRRQINRRRRSRL